MKNSATMSDPLNQILRLSIADFSKINPWRGFLRFSLLGLLFIGLISSAWLIPHFLTFILLTLLAGMVYAFWLVCTHDMTHHTLTGWVWFDEFFARLISWPMFWPYGTYSELHLLHHAWNGIDLRDPERVQWTADDYDQGNRWLRWYIRHQGLIDIFLWGGSGLILKTLRKGFQLRSFRRHLPLQMVLDITGMMVIHSVFLIVALYCHVFWQYLLFWFLLERMIGIIIQVRDHLEHYGKWQESQGYLLTQLYATRNLKVNFLMQWLMGGLPYHSVHHAFPHLPFYQLPLAFHSIQTILKNHQLPLMEMGQGYFKETLILCQNYTLIESIDETS